MEPEFSVFHDKGNEENFFDRADYQFSAKNSFHTNFQYTRSWFQTPNSYDTANVFDQFGNSVGAADQRSKIGTIDIAPTFTHTISFDYKCLQPGRVLSQGRVQLLPEQRESSGHFQTWGRFSQETVNQFRTLANAGVRSDVSYVKGIHNVKVGAVYEQTFLRENDTLGLVDATLNCTDAWMKRRRQSAEYRLYESGCESWLAPAGTRRILTSIRFCCLTI